MNEDGLPPQGHRVDELVAAAEDGDAFVVARHGTPVAVVVGYDEFRALADQIEASRRTR